MNEQHTIRPGESLVVSTRKQVVTSKFRLDVDGRQMGWGLEEGIPTILPRDVAADVTAGNSFGGSVTVVKGAQGALPTVIAPEDQAGRDRFLGTVRTSSRKEQIDQLMRNEQIGPLSLADSAFSLIEAGWSRDKAIGWARQQKNDAVASGEAMKEAWIGAARSIVEKS